MARQTMSDLRHRRGGATNRQSSSIFSVSNVILLVTLGLVGTLWFFTLSLVTTPPDPYAASEILGQRSDSKTMLNSKVSRRAANYDPLQTTDAALLNLPRTPLPFKPAVPYLGVLIDAGRRYFPLPWLYRVVDRLADMNYNLIHLRLTDDQSFNVLLVSHPELAFPTSVDNPDLKVYTTLELRVLTKYAKKKGIRIMPEINVPGHAGSWAGGAPGLIVQCPEFICSEGYGIPLNVTHPIIRPLLTDIIKEIVDIFDDPPFLHLGGDEVNMAGPCFEEVGAEVFDYPAFEQVLKQIVKDVGYPEDRIVRWEMTGQDQQLIRAGKIEHFWESHPGDRHEPAGPFFVSHGLYFDTNGDENSHTVVTKSNKGFSLDNGKLPVAIIAGCFELSVQFWFDRNILGRLLSVAMGASNLTFSDSINGPENVVFQHKKYCNELGFGPTICEKEGTPMIPTHIYHEQWKEDWVVWKKDICERVTEPVPTRVLRTLGNAYFVSVMKATAYYWKTFPVEFAKKQVMPVRLPGPSTDDLDKLRKHVAPHTGVILDAVNSIVLPSRIKSIIEDDVAKLGFNIIQMRLIDNHGFTLKFEETSWEHSFATAKGGGAMPYRIKEDLGPLVAAARRLGIEMMPEISVSSDGGGWFNTGAMMSCPEHFCKSSSTPNNVNDPVLMPLLFMVIAELRHVFSSKFFHLGSDERIGSMPCFEEVGVVPDFDGFENKLTHLLQMHGILPDHILRTENARKRVHEGRTGTITQLRAGTNDMDEPDDIVFFTVDVEDGDAWTVYQRTKELVALEPLGIMAEVRALMKSHWDNVEMPKRLLAFSMAISELPTAEDPDAFAASFRAICETLSLDTDCTPPGKLQRHTSYIVDSEKFRKGVCDARTEESQKHIAKFVPPFYGNSTVAAKPVADKKKR